MSSSIDVFVPCYGYGRYLKECVTSILSQDVSSLRVLIIDDASPDNTYEIAQELKRSDQRVDVLRHSTNKGHIATYNEGLEWVVADYHLLLSADDYLLPQACIRAMALMDAHPEVGFTFGSALEIAPGGQSKLVCPICPADDGRKYAILGGAAFIETSGPRNIVPTPTAIVRTELQKRLGGYRAELPHSGDMELWFRLATHASVGVIAACQAVYRRHDQNMSNAYLAKSMLPDLLQRKMAIEYFIRESKSVLPDANALHLSMLAALGSEAVGLAHAAFDNRDNEACGHLCKLAADIHPPITKSLSWLKLAIKRAIGVRLARVLRHPFHLPSSL